MYHILCGLLISAVLTWLAGVWAWSVLHPASPRYSSLSAPRHADVPRTVLIADALLQFRLWLLSVFQKRAFICKVLGKLKLHCLLGLSGEEQKFICLVFKCFGLVCFLSRMGTILYYSLFSALPQDPAGCSVKGTFASSLLLYNS